MGKDTNKQGSTELHQYVVKNVLITMSKPHSMVWANNTGVGRDLNYDDRIIRFGLKGSSDIIGLYKGIFLAIEIKTGNAVQNKFQKNFEKRVRQIGGIYVVITEKNVEQVSNIVEREYQELNKGYFYEMAMEKN